VRDKPKGDAEMVSGEAAFAFAHQSALGLWQPPRALGPTENWADPVFASSKP
jgi:hypothetical protein